MSDDGYQVRPARWHDDRALLREVRQLVFVQEQGVPAELEWDGLDKDAQHFLAVTTDGLAVGTARLLADGRLGRMAVLPRWRRQGVGGGLLRWAIDAARRDGMSRITLHAQLSAAGFYAGYGFQAEGDTFDEAGIPHQRMTLDLKKTDQQTRIAIDERAR